MTRVRRGRNAKMMQYHAKNNARITRNNPGVFGSGAESGAAYVLYLRELRPDVGSNLGKYSTVLVNSNRLGGAANPRRRRLLGGLWSLCIWDCTRTRPVSAHESSRAVPLDWNQSVVWSASAWTWAHGVRPFSSSWVNGPPVIDDSFFLCAAREGFIIMGERAGSHRCSFFFGLSPTGAQYRTP